MLCWMAEFQHRRKQDADQDLDGRLSLVKVACLSVSQLAGVRRSYLKPTFLAVYTKKTCIRAARSLHADDRLSKVRITICMTKRRLSAWPTPLGCAQKHQKRNAPHDLTASRAALASQLILHNLAAPSLRLWRVMKRTPKHSKRTHPPTEQYR